MSKRSRSRRLVVLLGVALVPLLAMCEREESGDAATDVSALVDSQRSVQPGVVQYRYEWDWAAAEPHPDGGWVTTTDLGYRVHVTVGYMVSFSVQLVPCPQDEPETGLVDWLLGSRVAHASDGVTDLDHSGVMAVIESLRDPVTSVHVSTHPLTARYCRVHYLIARAPAGIDTLPADVDMEGTSLHLEGTWAPVGGGAPTAFQWTTKSASGLFGELEPEFDSTSSAAEVTVRRPLGSLFDGVDFGADGAEDGHKTALKTLRKQTEVLFEVL